MLFPVARHCYRGTNVEPLRWTEDAVLFWDEADAMFYDRGSAHRNWEVRDVNVLLQELELFQGICILAANRKIVLDKAL